MKGRKRFRKRVQRDFAVCIQMRAGDQVQRCVCKRNGRREVVTHKPMVCPAGHVVLWESDGSWRCEGVEDCDHTYDPEPSVLLGDCESRP